jgi:anti-sigma-K factor RskA
VEGLPPVASGRTYQAWFLAKGTPVSAGLMSVGSDGFAVLGGLSPAPATDTIALTVETAGGAPRPTGQPIVLGQVGHPVASARLLRRSS